MFRNGRCIAKIAKCFNNDNDVHYNIINVWISFFRRKETGVGMFFPFNLITYNILRFL